MEFTYEIIPLQGFGPLKFGTEIDKVFQLLGEPEEIDTFENDADFNAVLLHYWEMGVSIFFQGDSFQVVAGIETDIPEATLFGKKVIGLSKEGVIQLMKENGYEEYDMESDEEEVRLSFEDVMVDFYLKENEVAYVNWDVLVDDNGEVIH